MSTYDDALVEKAARALAEIEPGDDWPTNEELGGGPTGTRDDEYRDAMREQAQWVLDAVADDLRAEGWDEGYDTGEGDVLFFERGLSTAPDAHEHPHDNPYRRERCNTPLPVVRKFCDPIPIDTYCVRTKGHEGPHLDSDGESVNRLKGERA